MPVNNVIHCGQKTQNIQEREESQRSSVDHTGRHFGTGTTVQESQELSRSQSGKNSKISFEPQLHYDDQRTTRSNLVNNGSNVQSSHEQERSTLDQTNRGCIFGIRTNIYESRELPKSLDDQTNSRSRFGSGNNIHESCRQQSPFGDQITNRLIDNVVSYEKNIDDIHKLQRSFGYQTNCRSHFGRRNNIHKSRELPKSLGDQINIRDNLADSGASYEKNVQDIPGLQSSYGNPINDQSHLDSVNSIHKSHLLQESLGNGNHFGFQKTVQEGAGLLNCPSDQMNNTNPFGFASDWWIYECILKGQTDWASELCRIINPSNVQHLNHSTGSISEAYPSGQRLMANLSTIPRKSMPSLAFSSFPPNISNGSRSETGLLQCASTKDGCQVRDNLRASIVPDSLDILPPNILSRSISESSPCQSTFHLSAVSHNLPANVPPESLAILPSNIFGRSTSEASSVDHTIRSNLRMVSHEPTVPDDDPLGAGTISVQNSEMNSMFPGADEVKNLQMDAIMSSISFDNLLRAIS